MHPVGYELLNTDTMKTTTVITGLGYLEGETVAVIADGGVHPTRVVTNGQITLDREYTIVHTGLPYTSYAQIMDIDSTDGRSTDQNTKKKMNILEVKMRNTVGLKAGPSLDKLERQRVNKTNDPFGIALEPFTGVYKINLKGRHNEEYAPYLVQELPQPQEILGFVSPISIGV